MLTPLGRVIRKLRLDYNKRLKDMADDFSVPSSYLSAIENGRKQASDAFVSKVHGYFKDSGMSLQEWRDLAIGSKNMVKVDLSGATELEREVVMAFQRGFRDISAERQKQILNLVKDPDD